MQKLPALYNNDDRIKRNIRSGIYLRGVRIIDKLFSNIIRQLLETNDYITTAELAKSVGISESTVKHNLNDIELALGREGLSLSRRRGKGIALIASDSKRKEMQKTLESLNKQMPEYDFYRRNYILETLLEYHHNYTIQLFSEELCVSKNAIIKDLESLKDMLSQMHLTLSIKRNNGVAIAGNEFYMRQMIIINNNERHLTEQYLEPPVHVDCRISRKAYTYFNTCYRYMEFDLILRQVKQAEKNLGIHFTDISLGRVMEYVAISVQRIKNGLVLQQMHKDGLPRPPAPYLKEAGRLLFELLAGRRFARETECIYLGARLYAAKTSSMKSSQLTKEFEIEAAEFVERVGSVVMDMELACDRGLIHNIGVAIERLAFIKYYEFVAWDNLHYDIQEHLAGLYGICLTNIEETERKLGVSFTPDDIAWITLMIGNAIRKRNRKCKAVLVSGADESTALYQKNKIQDEVKSIDIIKTFHYKEFDRKRYVDMLVIWTVHVHSYDENYVEVTKHISEEDIRKIACKVELLQKEASRSLSGAGFMECFWPELVLLDVPVKDKGEAVQLGSKCLREKGFVEVGFEQAIWEREQIRPTYIGNQVAIPHVFREHVNKSAVVVMRLKHAIQWSTKNKVKLIFLLAVNFDNRKALSDFFKTFYMIISDKKKLEMLQQANSSKEFLNLLSADTIV